MQIPLFSVLAINVFILIDIVNAGIGKRTFSELNIIAVPLSSLNKSPSGISTVCALSSLAEVYMASCVTL